MIVVPVLMMIVLFVVWAGRIGNASLAVELAAEEAAVAAALSHPDDREQVAEAILTQRADLSFLCVAPPTPVGDSFVTEVQREFTGNTGVGRGIGLLGVALRCETDGAVPVLRGLAPTVVQYGRGTEPFLFTSRVELPEIRLPDLTVPMGRPKSDADAGRLTTRSFPVRIELDRPVTGDSVIVTLTTGCDTDDDDTTDDEDCGDTASGGDSYGQGGCKLQPDDSNPAKPHFFDYLDASISRIIQPGEQRAVFPITLLDDCIDEDDEQFTVNVTTSGALLPSGTNKDKFKITIIDNDKPPLIGFTTEVTASDDCRTGSGGSVILLSEDSNESPNCDVLQLQVELRNPDRENERVLSGRAIKFNIASISGTATHEQPPGDDNCSTHADFTKLDMDLTFKAASGKVTDPNLHSSLREPHKEAVTGYNVIPDELTLIIDSSDDTNNNDEFDEPPELFVLLLTYERNDDTPDNPVRVNTVEDPEDSSKEFHFGRTLNVEILDNESAPHVRLDPPTAGTARRTELEDPDFSLSAQARFHKPGDPSMLPDTQGSQIDLEIAVDVTFEFEDGTDMTVSRTFTLPRCSPYEVLFTLVDLAEVARTEGVIDNLTEISYRLASPPDPGNWGHNFYEISTDRHRVNVTP